MQNCGKGKVVIVSKASLADIYRLMIMRSEELPDVN